MKHQFLKIISILRLLPIGIYSILTGNKYMVLLGTPGKGESRKVSDRPDFIIERLPMKISKSK